MPSRWARTCSAAAERARSRAGRARIGATAIRTRQPLMRGRPRSAPGRRARRARGARPRGPRARRARAPRAARRRPRRGRSGTRPASPANASRSSRLTLLRSTAPPTLRDTDRPRRGPSAAALAGAREGVEHEETVADRPALAVDALELGATRQSPALRATTRAPPGAGGPPPSDAEPLPALRATALQGQTPGTRAHARAEPVGAGALSLLGLVGALHGRRRESLTAGQSSAPGLRTRPSTSPAQACAIGPARRAEFPAICDLPRRVAPDPSTDGPI